MDLRKQAVPMSEALGSGAALVAYIPEGKVFDIVEDDLIVPLESVHMMLIRNGSKPYTYRNRTVLGEDVAVPAIVNLNQFHSQDGVVHCGGPRWFMDRRGQVSGEPGKHRWLEGAVVDLREGGRRERYSFVPVHHNHANLLKWSKAALEMVVKAHDEQQGYTLSEEHKISDSIDVPQFYAAVSSSSRTFLTVRDSNEVSRLLVDRVNRKKYHFPLQDMTALDNGFVTYDFSKGSYIFHPAEKDEEPIELANPARAIQRDLQHAFGTDHPVTLYPLLPKAKKHMVIEGQSLWTPFKAQAENPSMQWSFDDVRRQKSYEVARQICVMGMSLSTSRTPGARILVPYDIAFNRNVWVLFPSGFRTVNLVRNTPKAFKSHGVDRWIDILDTPIRHDVWVRKKEKAEKAADKAMAAAK